MSRAAIDREIAAEIAEARSVLVSAVPEDRRDEARGMRISALARVALDHATANTRLHDGAAPGDAFEDLDPRSEGRVVTVLRADGVKASCRSSSGSQSSIRIDRLTDPSLFRPLQ